MNQPLPTLSPAGRRLSRPKTVEHCRHCAAASGENYGACTACTDAVERYWRADWATLLQQEGISPGSEDERLLATVIHAAIETQA